MAVQNLISAVLPGETKADVMQKLSDIRSKLSFLLTLRGKQINGLVKAGNGFAPFLEKAYNTVTAHPEILPSVFDSAEFKKDYQLSKDLTAIADQMKELTDSIQNTLIAVNSDAMTASLDVYSAVKQNRDKVPGLNVTAEEMAEFFKRTKKKADTSN